MFILLVYSSASAVKQIADVQKASVDHCVKLDMVVNAPVIPAKTVEHVRYVEFGLKDRHLNRGHYCELMKTKEHVMVSILNCKQECILLGCVPHAC